MQDDTPRGLGYHMPAEWAEHEATWLSWPKNPFTFPEEVIDEVEGIFAKMIAALSRGEIVKVLVDDEVMEQRGYDMISGEGGNMSKVRFKWIRSADVWIRDYGPTFLLHRMTGKKAAVKWNFNAWGGKYDDLLYDDITGQEIVDSTGVVVFKPGIVMEGGSIDVNGRDAVLTTEQCLLNRNRNPHLDKVGIEDVIREYIGVDRIIWLTSGIEGDDTDGHVDDFARFASDRTVLCAYTEGDTENSRVLRTNWQILRDHGDSYGLEIERLPMPAPLWLGEERRNLPASYANFYIGNKTVLLPVFDDVHDAEAIDIMKSHFHGREIVPIAAKELVYGYGGIHCVTQQEPSGRL